MFDFKRNWPIYILFIATIWFFIYVGYKGRHNHHDKNKEEK
ncbi:MAG: hypothetical protein ACMUJM_19935 [bacterium]